MSETFSVHSAASSPDPQMRPIHFDTDTDHSSQPLYIDSGDEATEDRNVIDLDASDASDYDSNDDNGLDLSAPAADTNSKLREMKCPICLESPDQLCVTECGHLYCGDCVFQALSSGVRASEATGECSICRKAVAYSKVVFLETRMGPLLAHEDDEYETDESIEDDRNVKVQKMHESLTYDLDEIDTLDVTPSLA
ncbi:E3 ubiquitin-protein ligase complex SLX5-SLX8 subunit SLX8 [Yarrowia sp. C11]|nr:E3 ubiquitin-protein ligase complex SLX5-SLX8 subunit SLX8 [Yarrowia sp. E02]KAG5369453.1 E3 ubiquitin-protein ligase complex SLX5-SLX8 subunit SLX8 [Yarrowia sp. C11]